MGRTKGSKNKPRIIIHVPDESPLRKPNELQKMADFFYDNMGYDERADYKKRAAASKHGYNTKQMSLISVFLFFNIDRKLLEGVKDVI